METAWRPQAGPQEAAIKCPFAEIFYGGARGGGKTDCALGHAGLSAQKFGHAFNGLFVRRELPMLDDAIERSHQIYTPMGATFNRVEKQWRWPSGARLRFRPLDSTADADKYQGQNLSHLYLEEIGLYPSPAPLDRLQGALRSAYGVPTQTFMTGNPGGAGQSWVRARYIDPAPAGFQQIKRILFDGSYVKAVYIPSKVKDNKILLENDPNYVKRLQLVGSPQLVKAWLEGDWGAVEGAFFECFGHSHIIEPREFPDWWIRFMSMDWGSAAPFSVGWWVVVGEDFDVGLPWLAPKGAIIRYREWYGSRQTGQGSYMGLNLDAERVAEGIMRREDGENITYRVLDPSAFAQDGGPSIAERMYRRGVGFRRADNRRVGRRGSLGGWDVMRGRMLAEPPMIYCFHTCKDSIRTIQALQHDPDKPEDLDTDAEDHAADDWRYACMSRPWRRTRERPLGFGIRLKTVKELIRDEARRKLNTERI
jgi:hypothetical protein